MVTADVLVLNRLYQPVNVVGLRRALVMLYAGAARALGREYELFDFPSWAALSAELGEETVGLVSRRIRIPRILVLLAYDRMPSGKIRFSRHNIFLRDENTCQYCRRQLPRSKMNLDHVIPRSQGGRTCWENIVASCIECNCKKGGRTPREANMRLARKPACPKWSQLVNPRRMRVRYREWAPFLNPVDASYWNTELDSD